MVVLVVETHLCLDENRVSIHYAGSRMQARHYTYFPKTLQTTYKQK